MEMHHVPPAREIELAYRREEASRRRALTQSSGDGERRGSWFGRRRRVH